VYVTIRVRNGERNIGVVGVDGRVRTAIGVVGVDGSGPGIGVTGVDGGALGIGVVGVNIDEIPSVPDDNRVRRGKSIDSGRLFVSTQKIRSSNILNNIYIYIYMFKDFLLS